MTSSPAPQPPESGRWLDVRSLWKAVGKKWKKQLSGRISINMTTPESIQMSPCFKKNQPAIWGWALPLQNKQCAAKKNIFPYWVSPREMVQEKTAESIIGGCHELGTNIHQFRRHLLQRWQLTPLTSSGLCICAETARQLQEGLRITMWKHRHILLRPRQGILAQGANFKIHKSKSSTWTCPIVWETISRKWPKRDFLRGQRDLELVEKLNRRRDKFQKICVSHRGCLGSQTAPEGQGENQAQQSTPENYLGLFYSIEKPHLPSLPPLPPALTVQRSEHWHIDRDITPRVLAMCPPVLHPLWGAGTYVSVYIRVIIRKLRAKRHASHKWQLIFSALRIG